MATAPPIEGSHWINSDPIEWSRLKDRVVVLVFWSLGCESSLVRLRHVQQIVEAGGGAVTAIAIHSPRFPYEEDSEQVRSVVTQYQIALPVLHDPDLSMWNRYGIEGWPTTVVVDASSKVVGVQGGNANTEVIAQAVTTAVNDLARRGIDPTEAKPLYQVNPLPLPSSQLAFPTSVAVLENGDIMVSDWGHNRLMILEPDEALRTARPRAIINEFTGPGALATTSDDSIFVAEPRLGRISKIDLNARSRRLYVYDLIAPAGLAIDADGSLVVADSGADVIYRVLDGGPHSVLVGPIAGSGANDLGDGAGDRIGLAQPTGLTRTEAGVVFCESATSRVRLLTDQGKVISVTQGGLFERGLVDGPANKALMQRPHDIAELGDGSLLVADTGNHRIRVISNRRVRTLGLNGLDRPQGLCVTPSGHTIVADTGNHRLVVLAPDLRSAWALVADSNPRDQSQSGTSQDSDAYPASDNLMSPAV